MTARYSKLADRSCRVIEALAAEGVPSKAIASVLGCSISAVDKYRRAHGLYHPGEVCKVEGCEGTGRISRGWCKKHWARWRRHGSPTCKRCGRDEHFQHALCRECFTADQELREKRKKAQAHASVACPHRCGRDYHARPAIACPPIGLPACPGGRAQEEAA